MSQFPPPPPQYPNPPMPQYGMPGMPMEPRRTSGTAIASLICGILGCLLITPFLAILLGIFGISATRNPRYSGRGMAIAGLILGLLWLGGFGLFGGGAYVFYVASKPVATVAQQFTTDMSKGDVTSAQTLCESGMTQEQLQAAADQMKPWGALKTLILPARNVNATNGVTTWELTGAANFANANSKVATFTLHKEADGSYKIVKFDFK